jgi:hypothetical protein
MDTYYYSYGDDFFLRTTDFLTTNGVITKYYGKRKYFNPNTLQWLEDGVIENSDDIVRAGIDYYFYGNDFYYRSPTGNWTKKNTLQNSLDPSGNGLTGYPRFELSSLGILSSQTKFYNNVSCVV